MDRALAVYVLVAVALAGCGSTSKRWVKPDATAADFYRDSWACAQQTPNVMVYRAGASQMGAFARQGEQIDTERYRACLHALGYERVKVGTWEGIDD